MTNYSDRLLLHRLKIYIAPHKMLLLVAGLCLAISLGLELYRPYLLKLTLDEAFPSKNLAIILDYALIYGLTIIISMISLFLTNYCLQSFGQRIIYEIRNAVFYKILSRSPEHFSSVPIGNLVTRVTNDTESLRSLYTDVVLKLGTSLIMIIGILVSMYALNVELAIIVTLLLPIMGGIIFVYQKYARKAFRGVRTKLAASNSAVQEVLNFIVIIKSYVGEEIMEKKYDRISKEFLAAGLSEVNTFAIFRPIVDFLFFVATIAILSFTNWFDSVIEAGTVFAFLQYMNKFFQPLKDVAEKYNTLQSSLAGAERLVPVLEEVNDVELIDIVVPDEFNEIKTIAFDHVWFSYENNEVYALKDINLTIKAGDFIGIAGQSGGGKSTLMSLLMGFYRPTKGRILINGYDMANYSPRLSREIIGYVFQDSHLFKGTIKDNLVIYDQTVPMRKIVEASKEAQLHEIINKLPEGYNTPVGYLGSLLSSGQKQLLALARVLLKEKRILVFDEATSNIDSQTELAIQSSIETIRGHRTIISIAHRLSTIRKANTIYLIQNGCIIEEGTFDDLFARQGQFYALWENQKG